MLFDRLDDLRPEQKAIKARLVEGPADVPGILPTSSRSTPKLERLTEALNEPERRALS